MRSLVAPLLLRIVSASVVRLAGNDNFVAFGPSHKEARLTATCASVTATISCERAGSNPPRPHLATSARS